VGLFVGRRSVKRERTGSENLLKFNGDSLKISVSRKPFEQILIILILLYNSYELADLLICHSLSRSDGRISRSAE
jgi:hypothetical protein